MRPANCQQSFRSWRPGVRRCLGLRPRERIALAFVLLALLWSGSTCSIPLAEAAYVRDLIRLDGSINTIAVELRAGVWRVGVGGALEPAGDTAFSRRVTNEVVIGIFRATAVNGVSDFQGELTGYFGFWIDSASYSFTAQVGRILGTKIAADYPLGALRRSDPFGILGGLAAIAVFFDPIPDLTGPGTSIPVDVSAATDGQIFASFGFQPAADRDLGGATGPAGAAAWWRLAAGDRLETWGGLNLTAAGPEYDKLVFPGVSNPLTGQLNSLGFRFGFVPATGGPWPWGGAGTLELRVVPEPPTGGLLACLILSGLGVVASRRSLFRNPLKARTRK
ncbi:MAG: hypothetical protein NZ899_00645 [Thermoguttaceae bacterium]|nr:hypothetical protein [Thermoguttaceae bacterium]MDW8077403.1 hypothetical protein [Thermoguttaceae bacterium]